MSDARSWAPFAKRYSRLKSPLAPSADDVAQIRRVISGCDGKVLLLGVTPALAGLGRNLVAIDHSADVIRRLWAGDSPSRRAILADWQALPFPAATFDAVIGDGSICSFDAPPEVLLAELRRVLRPAAIVALRCFCAPAEPETIWSIAQSLDRGGMVGFDELKWRIAMQMATSDAEYRVVARAVLDRFNALFPDREALLATTGWSRDDLVSVDAYAGTHHGLRFLPEDKLLAICRNSFASARSIPSRGYPLADRCPILVLR